ncbi:nuclear transport factor 2 family protein [Rhodococcus koreensis]|uniref:Steroid delta-isomerase n=1 Tax=Rhodococcus koreensis TaxID=99653 RepID=A0A1H4VQ58_9NOCA|nr:nuclear transport factor 2 family protein [Rhodococcus koreensis]QSE81116.1 nuclear transport factor 2 family protein [Rhodococcus koreensis]SEC83083.1 steroid delta-isomerase [Rhodococcus koreensis]
MAPSAEDIRKTVERYIEAVATGTAADVVALYAEGATVEDPVGTEPRTSVESLHEFYGVIEPLKQTGELLTLKIAGNSAAFHFSLVTDLGEQKLEIAPIDVMTFDDDGKITSMRAFWSQEDMITG